MSWQTPVRRQSEHRADYAAALQRLRDDGLLYRCFRTRREVIDAIASAPHGSDDPGPDTAFRGAPLAPAMEAQKLADGAPYAWRLSLERARDRLGGFAGLSFVEDGAGPVGEHGDIEIDPELEGDVILARKDLGVAYHLAVVVDDAGQHVSEVVRGCDLFPATSIQRVLQALLGLPTPRYRHHRLLLGPDGKRLAKRHGAKALRDLRAQGVSPADVRRRIGLAAG